MSTGIGGPVKVPSAAARTAAEALALRVVDARDYGVKGDGTTDDTTAFNAARTAARAAKATLAISGTPLISSALTISAVERWEFSGAPGNSTGDKPQSYLIKKATMTDALVTITAPNTYISKGGIVGEVGNVGDGFHIVANGVTLDHVYVQRCGNDGIRIGSDSSGANANLALLIRPSVSYNGRRGIFIDDADHNANCATLINPFAIANTGDGIRIGRSMYTQLSNPLCETNTGYGLYLEEHSETTVTGGDCEGNTAGNFYMYGFRTNDIIGLSNQGVRYNSRNTVRFKITPTATLYLPDLYFDLSLAPDEFWRAVTASGGDVRVFKQDGITEVAREISGFDKANKKGGLWFAAASGTAFYVCAGTYAAEPAANATYGKYAVWETACKLRMHLASVNDSTANQLNAGATTAALVDAKLGKGYKFTAASADAEGHIISVPANEKLDFATAFTVGGWWKQPTSGSGALLSKAGTSPYNGYVLYHAAGSNLLYVTVNGLRSYTTGSMSSGSWYRVLLTWDGTNLRLYQNGALCGSPVAYAIAPASSGFNFRIGSYMESEGLYTSSATIDEVIAYDRAWSADEISQDYAMENSPSTWWTVGSAEWWMA